MAVINAKTEYDVTEEVSPVEWDPVTPQNQNWQEQDYLNHYNDLDASGRMDFVAGLSSTERNSLYNVLPQNEQQWLTSQDFGVEDVLFPGTPATSGSEIPYEGDFSISNLGDVSQSDISGFMALEPSDQEAYLSSLTSDEQTGIWDQLSSEQQGWMEDRGYTDLLGSAGTEAIPAGQDPANEGSDALSDQAGGQRNAQDLYQNVLDRSGENAEVIAHWQSRINEVGWDQARLEMMSSAEYINRDETTGEDWLIGDPDGYIHDNSAYDPTGIADDRTTGEFYDEYLGLVGPHDTGMQTGSAERNVFDYGGIEWDKGITQAKYIAPSENWTGLMNDATAISRQNMTGELSDSVLAQARMRSATGAMNNGIALSPAAARFAARDLGLTSLDIQNLGVQQSQEVAKQYEAQRANDLQFVIENAKIAESGRQFNGQMAISEVDIKLKVNAYNEGIRQFNKYFYEGVVLAAEDREMALLDMAVTSQRLNQSLLETQAEFGTTHALAQLQTVNQMAQFNAGYLQRDEQWSDSMTFSYDQYETDISQWFSDFNQGVKENDAVNSLTFAGIYTDYLTGIRQYRQTLVRLDMMQHGWLTEPKLLHNGCWTPLDLILMIALVAGMQPR